jgi:hypothetical protein
VSGLGQRLQRATAGVGQALGRRRPGVELVRVDRPELLAPLPPRPLPALPAPDLPLCPRCRTRHEPRPHPAGGRGLAALYGRPVVPDPTRPAPLGRTAVDPAPLLRDQANPWRHGTPEGWER